MRQTFSIVAVATWAVVVLAGCTVQQTEAPNLTGPSGTALSLNITATPDTINLGPSSTAPGDQSVVVVEARDSSGKPKAGQRVKLDIFIGGVPEDCGQLSTRDVVTDVNGRATAVFTAPPGKPVPLPECMSFADSITIGVTPVGSNFQTATVPAQSASIRLLVPSVTSTSGAVTVNFSISPSPGTVNVPVNFNDAGSLSPGHTITGFLWNFADGVTKSGPNVTHDFGFVGTFAVTLTVTDDIGQSSFKTGLITIN